MSSIAGPSSHTFSTFSAPSPKPSAISTQLRHAQDGPDQVPATPSSAGTPVIGNGLTHRRGSTTAPTTAPATPIARSSSVATTELRETSQGPAADLNGTADGSALNGAPDGAYRLMAPQDPKVALIPDFDAIKARAIALSRKQGRGADEEDVMAQTAAR